MKDKTDRTMLGMALVLLLLLLACFAVHTRAKQVHAWKTAFHWSNHNCEQLWKVTDLAREHLKGAPRKEISSILLAPNPWDEEFNAVVDDTTSYFVDSAPLSVLLAAPSSALDGV